MTPRSIILRGALEKFEYLGENETKNETILTHWSVAQAGLNDENNWGSKISLDCPFKTIAHIPFHLAHIQQSSFSIRRS